MPRAQRACGGTSPCFQGETPRSTARSKSVGRPQARCRAPARPGRSARSNGTFRPSPPSRRCKGGWCQMSHPKARRTRPLSGTGGKSVRCCRKIDAAPQPTSRFSPSRWPGKSRGPTVGPRCATGTPHALWELVQTRDGGASPPSHRSSRRCKPAFCVHAPPWPFSRPTPPG